MLTVRHCFVPFFTPCCAEIFRCLHVYQRVWHHVETLGMTLVGVSGHLSRGQPPFAGLQYDNNTMPSSQAS